MDFLEKDLEDIIFENAKTEEGKKMLLDRGLEIYGRVFRQVDLGSYGRIDLLSVLLSPNYYPWREDRVFDIIANIFELKKGVIDEKVLIQGMRYVQGLEHLFQHILKSDKFHLRTYLTLIGNKISDDDFVFLYNNTDKVSIYTYTYKIDGIHFDLCGKNWTQTNPKFNEELVNVFNNPGVGFLKFLIENEQDYTEEE